jgi:hypothetical protein
MGAEQRQETAGVVAPIKELTPSCFVVTVCSIDKRYLPKLWKET